MFSYFQTEMSCCRRIVKLCRDCLLIVYQFAADAKAAGAASVSSQSAMPQDTDTRYVMQRERQEENILPAFLVGTWVESETLEGTWGVIRASAVLFMYSILSPYLLYELFKQSITFSQSSSQTLLNCSQSRRQGSWEIQNGGR